MTADGIVIRPATPADLARIVEFNALNHHPRPDGRLNERIAARTSDLLSGRHPSCTAGHCLVVELGSRIVGSATAIPQTWTLGGNDISVEMIEFVAVDRSLRGRGLGRQLMDEIHVAVAGRGATLTAIIGRPAFYERFGYHALPIGSADHRTPPAETLGSMHTIRAATIDDLDLIEASQPAAGLSVRRDVRTLVYELGGRQEHNVFRRHLRVVVRERDRRPLGWFTITPDDAQPTVDNVTTTDSTDPSDLGDVLATIAIAHPDVVYALGPRHPAGELLERSGRHDRLHIRIADAERLMSAAAIGHRGDFELAVDRDLWRLDEDARRLLLAVDADQEQVDGASAHLSRAAFLRVALGLESVTTVADYDADVEFRSPDAHQHLTNTFPVRPIHLWPVG